MLKAKVSQTHDSITLKVSKVSSLLQLKFNRYNDTCKHTVDINAATVKTACDKFSDLRDNPRAADLPNRTLGEAVESLRARAEQCTTFEEFAALDFRA